MKSCLFYALLSAVSAALVSIFLARSAVLTIKAADAMINIDRTNN